MSIFNKRKIVVDRVDAILGDRSKYNNGSYSPELELESLIYELLEHIEEIDLKDKKSYE